MPTINITNQAASQALRGQAVKVTLEPSAVYVLNDISIGNVCNLANSNQGVVYSIDTYGNSFLVTPIQPDKTFSGSVAGYLADQDSVDITT